MELDNEYPQPVTQEPSSSATDQPAAQSKRSAKSRRRKKKVEKPQCILPSKGNIRCTNPVLLPFQYCKWHVYKDLESGYVRCRSLNKNYDQCKLNVLLPALHCPAHQPATISVAFTQREIDKIDAKRQDLRELQEIREQRKQRRNRDGTPSSRSASTSSTQVPHDAPQQRAHDDDDEEGEEEDEEEEGEEEEEEMQLSVSSPSQPTESQFDEIVELDISVTDSQAQHDEQTLHRLIGSDLFVDPDVAFPPSKPKKGQPLTEQQLLQQQRRQKRKERKRIKRIIKLKQKDKEAKAKEKAKAAKGEAATTPTPTTPSTPPLPPIARYEDNLPSASFLAELSSAEFPVTQTDEEEESMEL